MSKYLEPVFAPLKDFEEVLTEKELNNFKNELQEYSVITKVANKCCREVCLNIFYCSENRHAVEKCNDKARNTNELESRSSYLCSMKLKTRNQLD